MKMRQHKISDVANRSNWLIVLDLKSIHSVHNLTPAIARERFTSEKQKKIRSCTEPSFLPSQQAVNPWECLPCDNFLNNFLWIQCTSFFFFFNLAHHLIDRLFFFFFLTEKSKPLVKYSVPLEKSQWYSPVHPIHSLSTNFILQQCFVKTLCPEVTPRTRKLVSPSLAGSAVLSTSS